MCTVTFIPKSHNRFILTSNRDESPLRNTIHPMAYNIHGVDLIFPKDKVAGGTWFGLNAKQRTICLLNGGFSEHKREAVYRMSRGTVVTDLLASEDILVAIDTYNFKGIEPFTLIVVDWSRELALYELVWDGSILHYSEKPLAPKIWSSSSLYSDEIKKKRESWFSEFIFKNRNPSEDSLLEFHKTAGEGSIESDLIIDRGFVKTKSISQLSRSKLFTFRCEDLQNDAVYNMEVLDNGMLKKKAT
jgi:hypothetical protein